MIRGGHLLRPGLVTPSQRLCPDEEANKSAFYNDWITPQDQRYGLLGVLFQEKQYDQHAQSNSRKTGSRFRRGGDSSRAGSGSPSPAGAPILRSDFVNSKACTKPLRTRSTDGTWA